MLEDYTLPAGLKIYALPSKYENEKPCCLKSYSNEIERLLFKHVFLKDVVLNKTCKHRSRSTKTRKKKT
jgi:hypothetical protein